MEWVMKYGLIDFDLTVKSYWDMSWNKKALLNIGDAAEYLVIERLYHSLGVRAEDIVRLAIGQLQTYRGEPLIVALNIALDSYVGYNSVLDHLSPDIIPVFLGMSFAETKLNSEQILCLKRFAPIGCRDERSYRLMQDLDIPSYLNGCTTAILDSRAPECEEWRDKIVLIDVPFGFAEHIPETMKNDIVFFHQELYCRENDMADGLLPSSWAERVFQMYASKPRLIVTSRFHGAVLSIANDIPCIVVLEKPTFRFSWIQNWLQIITESDYDQADWSVIERKPDYSKLRDLVFRVAKARISQSVFQYNDSVLLTEMQRDRGTEDRRSDSSQVLYYRKVWKKLQAEWDTEKEYTYGFWGVNDNAEALHVLIAEKYPKAKLVSVYDMFKSVRFRGIDSEHPRALARHKEEDSFYVIVTAYLASRVAGDVFGETGFPENRAFLCGREFVEESDL